MKKWLTRILIAALALTPVGVWADYTATQGSGSTVFAFVCSVTKICPAFVLIDSSNVEKATSGNPLRTDPTGTTPQPASQSGTWTVQPGNTANTTAWKVDGSAVTQPVSQATASNLKGQMDPLTAASWGLGAFASPMVANGQAICLYDGTNCIRAKGDETSGLWVNIKAGAGSGGTALADEAAFTQGTTNITPVGCLFINAYTALTTGHAGVASCDNSGNLNVNVKSATGLAAASTTSGQTGSMIMEASTATNPTYTTAQTNYVSGDLQGNTRVVLGGGTPETASATGTTAATTATLATAVGKTTYICGFSIRANATAAATGNATVTGTITGTLNFTQWTAPNASGLGVTEETFTPCVPASTTNTSIAVVSAAAGTGGVVSVSAWGYQQ